MEDDHTRPAFPFTKPEPGPSESGPPLPVPSGGGDWEKYLSDRRAQSSPAIDLNRLQAGDRLAVETKNTRYELLWRADGSAELSTNRPDRAPGLVVVQGCALGRASPVKPGVLFCGGSLEYHSVDGQLKFRTSTIKALAVLNRSVDQPARTD
ncbi:MAG TPA: hypothetical protein VFJ90_11355 [Candidatus Didemnitutus sp.]|nr:hypothetical protein [Candidatus Didemnitutus sp.]